MMPTPKTIPLAVLLLAAAALPAQAHVGAGATSSFAAGFMHPLSGLDHLAAMVAVGLWAALKGGRAIFLWPLAFMAVMLAGSVLGILSVPLPFVEPAILASVVALGLLAALAVDLPLLAGAAIVGLFALFHGHAHGAELAGAGILSYAAGFALATTLLHGVGAAAGLSMPRTARLAGLAAMLGGAWLAFAS